MAVVSVPGTVSEVVLLPVVYSIRYRSSIERGGYGKAYTKRVKH